MQRRRMERAGQVLGDPMNTDGHEAAAADDVYVVGWVWGPSLEIDKVSAYVPGKCTGKEREVIYQNSELNKNLSRGQCSCVLSPVVGSQCSSLDPLLYEIQV